MAPPSAEPPDLSSLAGAGFDALRPLLEKLADAPAPDAPGAPDERSELAFLALLLDRALDLLRSRSRDEIAAEALEVHAFLDGVAGGRLRRARPETFGGFRAVGRLLSEAARRSDPAAVDSILAAGSRGREILEALAERGEPLARSELKAKLGFTESHLSHLLRELEEAELVARYRPEGGRAVVVELGPVGREVVERSVLPSWIDYLAGRLEEIGGAAPFDPAAVERELVERGAPSKLAAARLAAALAALRARVAATPAAVFPGAPDYIRGVENGEDGRHFEQTLDRFGPNPPRYGFTSSAVP